MRELAILIFQSLDGVMQAPAEPEEDLSGGFTQGGWAKPYWNVVMEQVAEEAMAVPYDMLLGRKTYDDFKRAHKNSPINEAKKYLVSTTAEQPLWRNTEVIQDDVPATIQRLKSMKGLPLQVHGSHCLIQTLLAHDLIDEFRLWTFPLVLGSGKRLFENGNLQSEISLVKSRSTENGVVMGIYRRRHSLSG